VEHVTHLEEKADAQNILVGKPEGKRPRGRPMCRWVDKMKINLKEIGFGVHESQSTEVRDPMVNIKMSYWDVGVWTGFNWLIRETSSELL
jgi:hypothetical protein